MTPTPTARPTPSIPQRQIPTTSEAALALIAETEERISIDNAIIEAATEFGGQEDFIEYITEDLAAAEGDLEYYYEEYEILLAEEEWDAKYEEYPVATTIWLYLVEEMGLSNECAAGILGNMMVEAGGHSLSINISAYNSAGYYGICQWYVRGYHSQINNSDLITQLNYLRDTIEVEFTYSSVTYNQFVSATNARDASVYFARGYERCADPYGRQNCADTAYSYFVG